MAIVDMIKLAAKTAHEVNRAYCQNIGDDSQVPWDEAPKWQQDSAISGVWFLKRDPTSTPEQQHEAWSADKVADGWVYGTEKDADKKTHPCLVPYGELPREQQIKDSLFQAAVRSVLGL